MPYVRREGATIVGVYDGRQPGTAEEYLEEDHPDIVAFRLPPPPLTRQQRMARRDANDEIGTAILDELEGRYPGFRAAVRDRLRA